jgi:TonB family protein
LSDQETTPAQNIDSTNSEADDALALINKLDATTPLMASSSLKESYINPIPVAKGAGASQIDYEQTFLEVFLDGGEKNYSHKQKFRVTNVLRNVLQTGEIRVKVHVDKDGKVQSASILRGLNEILDEAILETVRKYRYMPGKVNGQPVRFSTSEVFRFQ